MQQYPKSVHKCGDTTVSMVRGEKADLQIGRAHV